MRMYGYQMISNHWNQWMCAIYRIASLAVTYALHIYCGLGDIAVILHITANTLISLVFIQVTHEAAFILDTTSNQYDLY